MQRQRASFFVSNAVRLMHPHRAGLLTDMIDNLSQQLSASKLTHGLLAYRVGLVIAR
ncbi:hypothetical protein ALT1000_70121 [Alteromonas macleodii]